MTDIIDRLKEPDAHYPGNFDTPKRANAMLSCLCQEAMEEIESLRQQLASIQELNDNHAFNAKYFKAEYEIVIKQLAEARQEIARRITPDEMNAEIEIATKAVDDFYEKQLTEKDEEIEKLKSSLLRIVRYYDLAKSGSSLPSMTMQARAEHENTMFGEARKVLNYGR